MKNLILITTLLTAFLYIPQAKAEESAYDRIIAKGEITCGVVPWAPYVIIDPNTKEWSGFIVDLFRKTFATLDIKVTFKEVVLGNQIQDLNTGRVDAICGDGPWTMSAAKFVDYSEPLYATPVHAYVRIDDDRFKKRGDLNDKSVKFTGIDGDLSVDLVQRLFPKAQLTTMGSMTDVSQMFVNIETKKADVAIVDPGAFSAYEKENPNKLKKTLPDVLGVYRNVISTKKGDIKTLGLVNQAVDNGHDFGIIRDVLDEFDPEHNKIMRIKDRYSFE
jgi:ABC-type amino acid transport substrate-binding protein